MALNYIEMATYQEATNSYSNITIDTVNGLLSTAGPLNIVLEGKRLNEQTKPNLNPSPDRDKELQNRHKDLFDVDKVQPAPKPKPEKKKEIPPRVEPAPKPQPETKNPINVEGKLIFSDRAKRDYDKNVINPYLIADLKKATSIAKIGNVEVTFAKEGHDPGSNHELGFAVDISAFSSGGNYITYNNNPTLFTTLGNIFVDALKELGYTFGESKNKLTAYLWQTTTGGNHFNHIHVSNKRSVKDLQWWEIHKQIKSVVKHIDDTYFIHPEKSFGNYSSIFGDDEEGAVKKMLKYKSALTKNFDAFKQAKNVSKNDLENMNTIIHVLNGIIKATTVGESYTGYQYIWWYQDNKWKRVKWNINWTYL